MLPHTAFDRSSHFSPHALRSTVSPTVCSLHHPALRRKKLFNEVQVYGDMKDSDIHHNYYGKHFCSLRRSTFGCMSPRISRNICMKQFVSGGEFPRVGGSRLGCLCRSRIWCFAWEAFCAYQDAGVFPHLVSRTNQSST